MLIVRISACFIYLRMSTVFIAAFHYDTCFHETTRHSLKMFTWILKAHLLSPRKGTYKFQME